MRSVFGHSNAGKVVGFKLAERIDNITDIVMLIVAKKMPYDSMHGPIMQEGLGLKDN